MQISNWTSPLLLNPRISWLILDVRPDWISWRWRNKLSRARPRPLSNSPWVRTPRTVLLPASTLPSTASRRSINYSAQKNNYISSIMWKNYDYYNPAYVDWVTVLHPTRHKIGHFGDVLPSQSLGLLLKKNATKANTHLWQNKLQHKISPKTKTSFGGLL